jgi:hypothetical protein
MIGRSLPHRFVLALAGILPSLLLSPIATAQRAADNPAPAQRYTMWDLELGTHASQLRRDVYFGFACGTDGGPPSIQLKSWMDYSQCPPDPETGLQEVYFRYDEEQQYRGLANDPLGETGMTYEGTSEFQQPVIVSGLFDKAGFLVGVRMVTDPRTTTAIREYGVNLADALQSRFGFEGWTCTDLPHDEGDTPYKGALIKTRCTKELPDQGVQLTLDRHYYRKKGQRALDPVTHMLTEGQFVSRTRFESLLNHPIPNEEPRAALLPKPQPTAIDQLAAKAHDCPGCNFTGANLKWADLRGANLAGADLSGALAAKSELIGVSGEGLTATQSDFRMARMLNAHFAKANFTDAWFNDAQLSRSDLSNATLVDTRLWATVLADADLTGVNAHGADLTNADLRGADLSSSDFSGANLHLAKTGDIKTENTNFQDAQLPAALRNRGG